VSFIEDILRDPETGKPFVLLDAEKQFLAHAYQTDEAGRLVYPEQVYACPKIKWKKRACCPASAHHDADLRRALRRGLRDCQRS